MILNIYTLLDSKAGNYSTPFFMLNDALAIRMLTDLVSDPQTLVSKHPEDFSLFNLGRFDDATGEFTSSGQVNLGNAAGFTAKMFPVRSVNSDRVQVPS